jgi:hypothetical protein
MSIYHMLLGLVAHLGLISTVFSIPSLASTLQLQSHHTRMRPSLMDTNSFPMLFETMTVFSSEWYGNNGVKQLNVFTHSKGNMRCQFALNDDNDKLFRIEVIDGVVLWVMCRYTLTS